MYTRIIPKMQYYGSPCSHVAVQTARDELIMDDIRPVGDKWLPRIKSKDGWCTLSDMNRCVRKYFNVAKRVDYKRGQRPTLSYFLRNIENMFGNEYLSYSAIIVVYGHCIFMDKNKNYYSYYENEDDEVVAVWFLKNEHISGAVG